MEPCAFSFYSSQSLSGKKAWLPVWGFCLCLHLPLSLDAGLGVTVFGVQQRLLQRELHVSPCGSPGAAAHRLWKPAPELVPLLRSSFLPQQLQLSVPRARVPQLRSTQGASGHRAVVWPDSAGAPREAESARCSPAGSASLLCASR